MRIELFIQLVYRCILNFQNDFLNHNIIFISRSFYWNTNQPDWTQPTDFTSRIILQNFRIELLFWIL